MRTCSRRPKYFPCVRRTKRVNEPKSLLVKGSNHEGLNLVKLEDIRPNKTLRGPLFAEPVEVIVTIPYSTPLRDQPIAQHLPGPGHARLATHRQGRTLSPETGLHKAPGRAEGRPHPLPHRRRPVRHLRNRFCSLDSGSGFATFHWQTGTQDFTYSPLDTPATASGGVIF